ncbi:hypothetical protein BGX31_000311 [Mortierella sp. GBA43]|nr:hypothetical protein BGX31_000311 [Mortierella sp. GBA43]
MDTDHPDYTSDDAFTPIPLALPPDLPTDSPNMLLREDEQKGWIQRTLTAAGLDDDHDTTNPRPQKRDTNPFTAMIKAQSKSTPPSSPSPAPSLLLPPVATLTTLTTSSTTTSASSSPSLLSSSSFLTVDGSGPSKNGVPLPRPKSTELPQSLHSYLSTVFDVNWSVELPSKEDLLFTAGSSAAPSSSTSPSGSSVPGSASLSPSTVVSKRKSITVASGLSTVSTAASLASSVDSTPTSPSSPSAPAPPPSVFTVSPLASISSRTSTASTSSTVSSISSASSTTSVSSTGSAGFGTPGLGASGVGSAGPRVPAPAATLVRKRSQSTSSADSRNHATSHEGSVIANNATILAAHGINLNSKNMPVRKSIHGLPKQVLVPGRRSSLLQAGQLLTPSATDATSSHHNILHNTASNRVGPSGLLTPPQTLAPPGSSSPATSPTLLPVKPTISKRTSSLPAPSPSQPMQLQRAFSSDHALPPLPASVTTSVPPSNIIGLPRPLLNPPGTPELSSSPPSMTTPIPISSLPSSNQHSYSRSLSDDQILHGSGPRPTGSSSPSAAAAATTQPHHLKTSKSSPCLVSGYLQDAQDELLSSAIPPTPAMPNRYLPSNLSHPPVGISPPSSLLMQSPQSLSPTELGPHERMIQKSMSGPALLGGGGGGALAGNHYYDSREQQQHQRSGSYDHNQGLNGFNMMAGTGTGMHHNRAKVAHPATTVTEKPAATGRWNSMKMMLGLRAGAKG